MFLQLYRYCIKRSVHQMQISGNNLSITNTANGKIGVQKSIDLSGFIHHHNPVQRQDDPNQNDVHTRLS